jgi:hypothetical protein
MQMLSLQAKEAADRYGVPVAERDDAVTILGKSVGLKKQQIIRLFSEMGWLVRRHHELKTEADALPTTDDLDLFSQLALIVALAREIPHNLRMNVHPRFEEFLHLFTLAIFQFAYGYPSMNTCSQEYLRWLFDGLHQMLLRQVENEQALIDTREC